MTRSPQEVFTAHKTALAQRDAVAIVQDFREDAVLLTAQGAMEGRSGVETFYTQALAALPQMEINYTSAVYAGDALLVQWTASSTAGRITDGVDTFIFADGAIRLQTSAFTIEPMASL